MVKALWAMWKSFAHRIGNVQARIILSLFYFVVLGPFALGMKLLDDPLRLSVGTGSQWLSRPSGDEEALAWARRQF
jgi:hypothetical protein